MQKLKILNKKEVKKISGYVNNNFGTDLPANYAYLLSEKDRLYIINKDFANLSENVNIDSVGLYFGTISGNQLRLSIEGSQIIAKTAKKNILELSDNDFKQWMKGEELKTSSEQGLYIIKNKKDIAGCGSSKEGKLINFIPKERRS